MPGLSDKVSRIVTNRITAMGIETKFSTLITQVEKDYVMLNNKDRIDSDLLIWTGGVRSCRLPVDVELERDKKDRAAVETTLSLKKYPNVFVSGDNVCFIDPVSKKPVPQTAQEAIHEAKCVAKNIYRTIKNKPLAPYHPGPTRFIIPVTGKFAVFYSTNLIISGFAGWVLRKGVDLRYFMSILPWTKAFKYWLFENEIFIKND